MKPHIGRARYGKPRIPDILLLLKDKDGDLVVKEDFGTELPQRLAVHRPGSPFGEFVGWIRRRDDVFGD